MHAQPKRLAFLSASVLTLRVSRPIEREAIANQPCRDVFASNRADRDRSLILIPANRPSSGDLRLVGDRGRSITQNASHDRDAPRIDSNGNCATLSRQDEPSLGRLGMPDHSEMVYLTSEGMDYPAHEQQYQTFIKILVTATAAVITIVVLMAIFLG
jgi:hypothetical protein